MQIHEITKKQLEEGILGDLKSEVTKQVTQATTAVKNLRDNPKATLQKAGAQIAQGAQNAYQRYATPAGQLQGQNQKNAASAAASANKLAMQFGAPLYQEFMRSQKQAQPVKEARPVAQPGSLAKRAASRNAPAPVPSAPTKPTMSTAEIMQKQKEAMGGKPAASSELAKAAAPGSQAQNQLAQDPSNAAYAGAPLSATDKQNQQTQQTPNPDAFATAIDTFVKDTIKIDTNILEKELPVYGKQYIEATLKAQDARAANNPAAEKTQLTYAFGIAKLAAMKLKKDAEGGSRGTQQSSNGRVATDDRSIQQAADAIKKVMGNTKVRQTSDQALNKVLNAAGVLGEGKK